MSLGCLLNQKTNKLICQRYALMEKQIYTMPSLWTLVREVGSPKQHCSQHESHGFLKTMSIQFASYFDQDFLVQYLPPLEFSYLSFSFSSHKVMVAISKALYPGAYCPIPLRTGCSLGLLSLGHPDPPRCVGSPISASTSQAPIFPVEAHSAGV